MYKTLLIAVLSLIVANCCSSKMNADIQEAKEMARNAEEKAERMFKQSQRK
jgi:hypothetical protein